MRTWGIFLALGAATAWCAGGGEAKPSVAFPLDRTAYFVGERVVLAVTGLPPDEALELQAVNSDGRVALYRGKPGPILLDTSRLAPGDYALEINGSATGTTLTLTSTVRKSPGSLQDEVLPGDLPRLSREERRDPALRARKIREHREQILRTLRETGLSACISMAVCEMKRRTLLDTLARAGTLLLVNPDTRPTSFFPTGADPAEIDGVSQRMILTAQANGRYPNFGGFCFGWDTTGHAVGGRKGLLTYWGWGQQEQALRRYIARQDQVKMAEFSRRTGLRPVSQEEYVRYLLSIGRPEFAPAIDLPTKLWLEEMARYIKPLPEAQRASLEKRLDAWSGHLMGLYAEGYSKYAAALRGLDPTLRNTSSVNLDHCAVIYGQYIPSAYQPLDFQYMSAWNDQVGGPDYLYQWLLTAGLLNTHRRGKPTWVSHSFGAVHARSAVPGKFVRAIAHNLAHGGSGAGFAHEGFSNLLGGMNKHSRWESIRDKDPGRGVLAGRDLLDRFAALALEGRGEHGVGILFSKSQFARQCIAMGFGTPHYKAFVALTRLSYTPRFVTEEEIIARGLGGVKALVVVCQTVPLPGQAMARLDAFVRGGGRILVDGSTIVRLPRAERMDLAIPFSVPGKPHNWASPNMAKGENDLTLYERDHAALAAAFLKALGPTGRALFASEKGAQAQATVMQIDGGRDATYLVAVNDSHVRTHCDWHSVQERLLPTRALGAGAVLYDCTEEKLLGEAGPFLCDLSRTTARVYAVLPRAIGRIALAASQSARAGERIALAVEFQDGAGQRLEAVLPFQLAIRRPDGRLHQELHRSTSRAGVCLLEIRLPANVPAGVWSVAVRSQLTGEVATLSVTVEAAEPASFATPLSDRVVVRERASIETLLAKGTKLVLPLFDTPHLPRLLPVAEKVRACLAARGVAVEIRQKPATATYWLAYDPTPEQLEENARADRGEAIGRIKRTTVNHNDWHSGMSGYRFARPVVLLDLAGEKDNEMAEALDQCGILWPRVSDAFPGKGRAVVQLVHWAFAPRTPALVIQAADVEGLLAGAQALAELPEDRLTPGIQAARAALWRQYHIGGKPAAPEVRALTARGLTVRQAPQPFAIRFAEHEPPAAGQIRRPAPHVHPAHPVPATLTPPQFVTCMRVGERYVEAASPGRDWPRDLRFSQALLIVADVKKPGRTPIIAEGLFRYSDRRPRSQAQWEDLLAVRDKLVPKQRLPMAIDVTLGEKTLGKLVPVKTERREVPVETLPSYAKQKPKSAIEEVVVRLAGEIDLPAGRQELLLIHRNIVDGVLERLHVGGRPGAKQGEGRAR